MNLVKTYHYKTKNGLALGHVNRYETFNESDNSKSKSIIPYFNNGSKGIPKDMPAEYRLFGLDSISDVNEPVFIVEGEKCAHALHGLGFQVVTSLGGSNAVYLTDWSALNECKNLYFLPDNDEAGEQYMQSIYEVAGKVSNALLLRVLEGEPKADIVDWLASLECLSGWNGLDDLHEHPNRDEACKAFENLYRTKAEAIPAEWCFTKTKGKLKAIDAENFERLKIPERNALLHPVFMEASINMVYAQRGLGKTMFTLACCIAMAKGEDFLTYFGEKNAVVLYLDGEMQAPLMQERIRTLSSGNLPKSFHLFTPDFQDDTVTTPDLATKEGQKLIDELIEALNVDLVVIDNISCFMRTGNENDADSWSTVQPWLIKHRSKGRSFILVHHSNKSGDQRGSNKKEDVMDVVIHLSRPDDYINGEDRTRFIVHFTKARHLFGEEQQDLEAELFTEKFKSHWSHKVAESSFDKAVMLLKEGGISQKEIAEELKVHSATITKWKKKAEAQGLL